jgi:uncharacterized protein YndB with AHSA1/START domain
MVAVKLQYIGLCRMCNRFVADYPEVVVEVPDSIERELISPVPPERVWTALTRPDQLSAWFGTQATIDLRPGGDVVFTWDGSTEPRGDYRGVIKIVEPPRRLEFQLQSSQDIEQMTRVEFTLESHPDGTRLRLVESGFASLPPELRSRCHESNVVGWQRELGELEQYLAERK